ncbi:MAG TPA: peptidylprolyl isomerase, partial [Acidimicrobiales bacterium]|nr:peptidylprolyl isomerase [Acidimicrobiales bacterium]
MRRPGPSRSGHAGRACTRPSLVALLAGLALVLAACGSSSPAATVDGETISRGDLEGELRDIASNDKYLKYIESQVQIRKSGVFDASFTASVLSRQIVYSIVERDLEARKVTVAKADLDAARPALVEQMGGDEIFNAFPTDYQETLIRRSAQVTALSFALLDQGPPDEVARAYYEEHKEDFAQVCVGHILVRSQEEAEAAKARIDAGEDFGAVAKEVSTDTGSKHQGGQLGCFGRDNSLVPEFTTAMFSQPVGEVGAPVQSQFGYHVIKVTSHEVPPYEEVAAQVRNRAAASAQEKLTEWVDGVMDKAKISVNPKYGHFEKRGAQSRVVPPQAPTTAGP